MDLAIVKALCNRRVSERLRKHVPESMLAQDAQNMLGWIALYWATYPDDLEVSWTSFKRMLELRGDALGPEDKAILKGIARQLEQTSDTEVASTVQMITERALSGESAALIQRYNDGAEVDLIAGMKEIQRKYSDTIKTQDSLLQWESRNVDDVLEVNEEQAGLKIRFLPMLTDNLRGLKGGDTIGVAAAVDSGKTSLLACAATDFAEQMKDDSERYGNRPILWLVNESLASRTVPRIYQAATGLTLQGIRDLHKENKFAPKYLAKVGSWDRIRVKDAHSLSMAQVSQLLEEMKPAVLIIDMVANIKGSPRDSEHQTLEARWQELRELGCEHDCIMIGTIQLSIEGYDTLYPPLHALKQSKNGVQGTFDLAIYMGRRDPNEHPELSDIRGISTPKNKVAASGKPSSNRAEVVFNAGICQFE